MDAASKNRVRGKRPAFADVNSRQDALAGADSANLEENKTFTKEEVEALLNYKPNHEANAELMSENNKRLRLCIKWFQTVEETLQSALNSAESKYIETEIQMAKRLEELDGVIAGLRNDYLSLQEQLAKEAINCHSKEKEGRIAVEKVQATLLESLEKCKQEILGADRQEYNTSLQQNNIILPLGDEAIKQKESFAVEVKYLREELQQAREDRDNYKSLVQAASTEALKGLGSSGKLFLDLDKLMIKFNALQEKCSTQSEQIRIFKYQLTCANEKLKMTDMSAHELQDRLASAETRIIEGEVLRKKLHNTISELKGNIRVFCRVRPLMPDDSAGSDPVVAYPTSTDALGRGIELLQSGTQKHPFTFDKVFSHDASQESVFVEISPLVQSALDGYKVCIFAYGQTGSGKTYTMMGKPDAPEQKGLIPRSLEQIFETSQALVGLGWKYKLQASMLEIYNETIRDLLVPNKASGLEIFRSENRKPYKIKHNANENTYVSDLTIVDVCSIEEISMLLEQAAQNRSVGKTNMNEESSRSHFVFTLDIVGVNENTKQQVQGVLNLIDLAGSERLSKSCATGDRLKETQAINKSLSSLGDVIFALAKKEDHIPFRNSKLTYLLQPCLGGESKTLMFVNISSDPSSVDESLCSLRFAARVNACEIGVPRR